jgi:hypothetical protein
LNTLLTISKRQGSSRLASFSGTKAANISENCHSRVLRLLLFYQTSIITSPRIPLWTISWDVAQWISQPSES